MSDEQKNISPDEQKEVELDDLTVAEPEVEVLTTEDARAIPESSASFGSNNCCTLCSSSL